MIDNEQNTFLTQGSVLSRNGFVFYRNFCICTIVDWHEDYFKSEHVKNFNIHDNFMDLSWIPPKVRKMWIPKSILKEACDYKVPR